MMMMTSTHLRICFQASASSLKLINSSTKKLNLRNLVVMMMMMTMIMMMITTMMMKTNMVTVI